MRHRSDELIDRLTALDYTRDVAFAAVVPDFFGEKIIGVSRYSTSADGTACECAVTVLDEWQQKGLGVVLTTRLIDVARARGIRRMWSLDLAENSGMSDLAPFLGFQRRVA